MKPPKQFSGWHLATDDTPNTLPNEAKTPIIWQPADPRNPGIRIGAADRFVVATKSVPSKRLRNIVRDINKRYEEDRRKAIGALLNHPIPADVDTDDTQPIRIPTGIVFPETMCRCGHAGHWHNHDQGQWCKYGKHSGEVADVCNCQFFVATVAEA